MGAENVESRGSDEQVQIKEFEELSLLEQAKALLAINIKPMEPGTALSMLPTPFEELPELKRKELLTQLAGDICSPEKGWRPDPPPPPGIPKITLQPQDPATGNFGEEEILDRNDYKTVQYYNKLEESKAAQKEATKQVVEQGKKLYWDVKPDETLRQLGTSAEQVTQYVNNSMMDDLFG